MMSFDCFVRVVCRFGVSFALASHFLFSLAVPLAVPLAAQDWSAWRALPVLDGGRVMPLSTFARHVVTDICGTETPIIAIDDTTLDELLAYAEARERRDDDERRLREEEEIKRNQTDSEPLVVRDLFAEESRQHRAVDAILGENGVFGRAAQGDAASESDTSSPSRMRSASGPSGARARRIVARIQSMFPRGGRTMEPHEIVLSWLTEPEIWHYIPFLPADDTALTSELFALGQRNRSGFVLTRVSPYHVMLSEKFRQQLEQLQRGGAAYARSPLDHAVARLDERYALFAGLRLDPIRQRPELALHLLQRLRDASGMSAAPLDRWLQAWQFLRIPDVSATSAAAEGGPVTPRSMATASRLLPQMLNAYDRTNEDGETLPVDFVALQQQFADLLTALDVAADEATQLQQFLYSDTDEGDANQTSWMTPLRAAQSDPTRRRMILLVAIDLRASVHQVRREVEAAWLALYDSGRTVRVLPITHAAEMLSSRVEHLTSPWLSLTALVSAHPLFLQRFVDRRLRESDLTPLSDLVQTRVHRATSLPDITDGKLPSADEMDETTAAELPPLAGTRASASDAAASDAVLLAELRQRWANVLRTFNITGADGAAALAKRQRFLAEFSSSLRRVSETLEPLRAASPHADPVLVRKTAYPRARTMAMEVRYDDLAPFFWMVIAAIAAIVAVVLAWIWGLIRREMIEATSTDRDTPATRLWLDRRLTGEEIVVWLAVACLTASAIITAVGGAMRAAITGWAPVTNMYETIILMAWITSLIGLYFPLSPLLAPTLAAAWQTAAFPKRREWKILFGVVRDVDPRERRIVVARTLASGVRLVLTMVVAVVALRFGFASTDPTTGIASLSVADLWQLGASLDVMDAATVVLTFVAVVWIVPRILMSFLIAPYFLLWPDRFLLSFDLEDAMVPMAVPAPLPPHARLQRVIAQGEDAVGAIETPIAPRASSLAPLWFREVRTRLVERKWFLAIPAAIVVVAGVVAMVHSEFNPAIRPLAAVLRSNFWLTVHVIAIMASYSAALVAWGLSLASVVAATTMRYAPPTDDAPASGSVESPVICRVVAPFILQMIRIAVVLLALGIVLGGRWADYSWGRFWGWDPKEVWALITMLYYALVLHGRSARLYGDFGLAVGGVLGAIPVVTTWYGINYVFRTGMHAYAGGTATGATIFLYTFIGAHIALVMVAVFRYLAETYRPEGT